MKEIPREDTSPVDGPDLWKAVERHVMAAGVSPGELLSNLRSDIDRSPDPGRSLRNLLRFLDAGFATSLLREFVQFPLLQRILITLLSQSQYLSDILVRDPELFRWLTASDALTRMRTRDEILGECLRAADLFQRIEKKVDAVKRIHRREYLRIGAREILQEAGIRTTTAELSMLADAVIEAVMEIAREDLAQRTGATFASDLVVIGLGKLGAEELNFSSDIDLMFVYDRDEPLSALGERVHSRSEFYQRVAEFAVRALSDITSEGRLYRVDLRLRPDGASGPLVMSRRATTTYYETRGELWERQMLLKARVVGGHRETGEAWLEGILPFVFPKTLRQSPLAEIAKIKRQIEARITDRENVKLGSGGIRDIEFTVQALQLLYGGANERLRARGTLECVDALEALSVLNPVEAASLREAYEFFRIVEHRLQLLHGLQTHSLPVREQEFTHLALRLGFESAQRLRQALNGHRRRVRLVYDSVFNPPEGKDRAESADAKAFDRLIADAPPEEQEELRTLVDRISANLELDAHRELKEALATAVAGSGAAVWTLRNLQLLAGAPAIHRTLQQSLKKSELASLIVMLASRSSRLVELMSSEPLLFETLVGQSEEFFTDRPAFVFLKEADPARFQRFNEFKACLQLFLGATSFESFARSVSSLAEALMKNVLEEIVSGLPNQGNLPPLCVMGLGKFGGGELTVGSDLDCVVVYTGDRSGGGSPMVESVAQSLLNRFRSLGLFAVDFRLRPEGQNAPLGTDLGYLREYFSGRASLWELQSLLKARCVAGDRSLGAELTRFVRDRLAHARLPAGWVEEIMAMRERMASERSGRGEEGANLKVGPGGLVDLEFAVQMLQLRYGSDDETFLVPNTFDAVRHLHQRGYISSSEWKMIMTNMIALRMTETLIRLNTPAGGSTLPRDGTLLAAFAAATGQAGIDGFHRWLEKIRADNRALLQSIAGRCRS